MDRARRAEGDDGRGAERDATGLLTEALRMPVAFVGAMGSRRTHRDRRLREAGLTEAGRGRPWADRPSGMCTRYHF
ncbi:hypothetical protein ACF07W_35260 [Streptomyces sp. NPDC015140]|uniref:hypothetical protein n=1 Tax=Streptomyces sp. NPDC015140 TaxID=3364943 RepID=UPI0036FC10B3